MKLSHTSDPPKAGNCSYTHHFSQDQCNLAFKTIQTMRKSLELCDILLKVGDVGIPAHKVILAASSPYFHAMFTNEMIEKSSKEVEIHDIDPQALELLIDYVYTSEIVISENNVQTLLPAACLLQMNGIRNECSKFLNNQLHSTNCLGIRKFADMHSCDDLLQSSHSFVLENFVEVCSKEEFLLLSFSEVHELVSSEELNINGEEQIFECIIKWIKHDLDKRQCHLPELLSCVKLPILPRDLLVGVESEDIVRNNLQCKDLIIEAMRYQLMPELRPGLSCKRTNQRQGSGKSPVIFAIGGRNLFTIHNECECFDPGTNSWMKIPNMSVRRFRCGVTTAFSNLYVLGGCDGSQELSSCESFNPRTHKWTRVPSMGTQRSCHGTCTWNNLIYVAGGHDGMSCLSSVERYDPLTLSWTSITAMNFKRSQFKLCVLNDVIYAIGGSDGSSHKSTIEKYDPKTNTWVVAPSMISRRSNPGVGVLNGMIYVCGGFDGINHLSTAERFNPRRNLWEAVPSMHTRRSSHGVVVLENCLYAVGGSDGSSSLNDLEMYNPRTNAWEKLAPMTLGRVNLGCAVVKVKH